MNIKRIGKIYVVMLISFSFLMFIPAENSGIYYEGCWINVDFEYFGEGTLETFIPDTTGNGYVDVSLTHNRTAEYSCRIGSPESPDLSYMYDLGGISSGYDISMWVYPTDNIPLISVYLTQYYTTVDYIGAVVCIVNDSGLFSIKILNESIGDFTDSGLDVDINEWNHIFIDNDESDPFEWFYLWVNGEYAGYFRGKNQSYAVLPTQFRMGFVAGQTGEIYVDDILIGSDLQPQISNMPVRETNSRFWYWNVTVVPSDAWWEWNTDADWLSMTGGERGDEYMNISGYIDYDAGDRTYIWVKVWEPYSFNIYTFTLYHSPLTFDSIPISSSFYGDWYAYETIIDADDMTYFLTTNASFLSINFYTGVITGMCDEFGKSYYLNIRAVNETAIAYQNYTLNSYYEYDEYTVASNGAYLPNLGHHGYIKNGDDYYLAYMGDGIDLNPYIVSYKDNEWGNPVKIGISESSDVHAYPSIIRDRNGYIHAFWGAYTGYSINYSISTYPDNIYYWTSQPNIADDCMYPTPFINPLNNSIYLLYIDHVGDEEYSWYFKISEDDGITWSSPKLFLDWSDGYFMNLFYAKQHLVNGNMAIHFACHKYNYSSLKCENVIYFYLNLTDENVYNINGDNLGVLEASEQSSVMAYFSGATYTNKVDFDFNSSGYPSLFLTMNDNYPNSPVYWNGTFIRWTGAEWTSPENVFETRSPGSTWTFKMEGDNAKVYISRSESEYWYGGDSVDLFTFDGLTETWTIQERIINSSIHADTGEFFGTPRLICDGFRYNFYDEIVFSQIGGLVYDVDCDFLVYSPDFGFLMNDTFSYPPENWAMANMIGIFGMFSFFGLIITPPLILWSMRMDWSLEGKVLTFASGVGIMTFFFGMFLISLSV